MEPSELLTAVTKATLATVLLIVALLACGTLRAADHHVNTVGELVAAINTADNGDVIILDGPGPYDLTGQGLIAITKNITIQSPGGTPRVICDSTPGRTDQSLLTTANVIWENIQLGDTGTTRVVTETVVAQNVEPPPTSAPTHGGTLGIDGENVTFNSTTFRENGIEVTNDFTYNAVDEKAAYGMIHGAAIDSHGANLVFNGPTAFNDNTITAVIKADNGTDLTGTMLMTGEVTGAGLYTNGGSATFKGNTGFSGNVIDITHKINGTGSGSYFHFYYDAATGAGSAISNNSSVIVFEGDATFSDNSITEVVNSGISSTTYQFRTGSGGTLFNNLGSTTFKGKSVFEDNEVATDNTATGGAVFLHGGEVNFDDTSEFSRNTVSGGSTWTAGGAIFVCGRHPEVDVYYDGILNINAESTFTQNTVAGTTGHGGAVCTDYLGVANFNAHAFFDRNEAAFGGALSSSHSSAVTNFYSTVLFDGNTATDGGGAVGFYDLGGTVNFYDFTQFTNNTAGNRGGAIDISSSNSAFTGTVNFYGVSEFENNQAVNDGGAMRIGAGGTANFNNSAVFRNNEAGNLGGAVYMDGGVMNVNLENPGENLLFELNTDTGGLSNAIHMTTDSVINFNHVMGADIYFNDNPITGDAGSINMTKCGTVHINGGLSLFEGDTTIYRGYWQLENNAEFGVSGSGNFIVGWAGALSGGGEISGDVIDLYGTILPGFYIDKGDYAYAAGTLSFNDATTFYGGSRYMPALWADGNSALSTAGSVTVEPGATIYLNFRPGNYSAGPQTYTTIASGNFAVEKAGFIDAGYDDATGEITLNGLDTNYFASHAGEKNQAFAERFDAMLADPNVSDVWWDRLSGMSLAIENGADADGIFNSLTGAQRANTIGMGLMTPKELAFRHIGREAVGCYPGCPNDLWFQPFYRNQTVRDDSDGLGYRVDQTGFFIGTDRRLTRRTYGGVFAGYSAPKLSADDYGAESDVFTIGMLGGLRCDNCWDVRSWAVFGYENTRMNRGSSGSDLFGESIYGYACRPNGLDDDSWSGGGGAYRGKSDGWTLATGLEVGRLWCCRWNRYCDLGWRPFVGIDYEQATQNGFDENGSGEFAIQYRKSTFSRTLLRTGISLTASGYAFDVTGRAMYTCLLAGDESPTSTAILPALLPDPYSLEGANCGRHFFSAGLDATFWLNEKRSRFLTTTYEASMGRRSTAQTVTLAFIQRF